MKQARSGISTIAEYAEQEFRHAERLEKSPPADPVDAGRKRLEAQRARADGGARARPGGAAKMADEPHAPRRGWLKNGNPPGDFATAPRCGAKTRRATHCHSNLIGEAHYLVVTPDQRTIYIADSVNSKVLKLERD